MDSNCGYKIPDSRSIQRIKNIAMMPKMIRWGSGKLGVSGFAMRRTLHAGFQI